MDQLAKILDGYIEKKRQKLTALSEEIWRYAEVGYQEFQLKTALQGMDAGTISSALALWLRRWRSKTI